MMLRRLIEWSASNPFIVLLAVAALVAAGFYSVMHINVEAYPDPAPPIIEVVAQYPGASAEEVERQVTIPLEVALAGMPGMTHSRSKSLFGLCHIRNQFSYPTDYFAARQEVINRLTFAQGLPTGVTPTLSPFTPTGELMRYTLTSPTDGAGRNIYTLHDLKSLQDWTLGRVFRRIPRIADVSSFGGMVKRYEVLPDPEKMKSHGITLNQLQTAISNSNANVGGDLLAQGSVAFNVRGLGLFSLGLDPMQANEVLAVRDPLAAAEYLRREEALRLAELREVNVTANNNAPIRIGHLVAGGRQSSSGEVEPEGVIVGHQTRLGKVSISVPKKDAKGRLVKDANGNTVWVDKEDMVQGIVLMRKNEETLPSLEGVKEKVKELNETPGRLLPGVQITPHFDLTGLIHVTTETVYENLTLGMILVSMILLMFLSNVRSAIIVAINIPLALFFAFSILYMRGKSANLLSIGAIDFGIIVDSSVIMVENIYRHLSSGEYAELALKDRILKASEEVRGCLLYSTAIMVAAFIPLFTMQGPEGQIFGPMAQTYAFALGGALILSVTVVPVMCVLLFRNIKPVEDNFLVRYLKGRYLRQLQICLDYRWATLAIIGSFMLATFVFIMPRLGREFMPELEEGNLYIRGTFPVNISLDEVADKGRRAREIMRSFPEVELVASQVARPDDGTDPSGFFNAEFSLPLRPGKDWPAVKKQTGPLSWFWSMRPRSKPELIEEMNSALRDNLIGIDWNFSQYIRDNVTESLSGIKGDNSVKIIGPDLDQLEELADRVKTVLDRVDGIKEVGIFHIKGQPNLEFPVDRKRCNQWGFNVSDVQNVIQTAVAGRPCSQMIEGEKSFDITLRWPKALRDDPQSILAIPVEVINNTVTPGYVPGQSPTPLTGQTTGVSSSGYSSLMPAATGSVYGGNINSLSTVPRRRLGDLVTPLNKKTSLEPVASSIIASSALAQACNSPNAWLVGGMVVTLTAPDPSFVRAGASTIYREQGNRLIAVKFSVRDRDLAGAVGEAQRKTEPLIPPPYRTEWSGEFQEMEEAEYRLMFFIPLSLILIFLLLYMAFHSMLDVFLVLFNVVELSVGGIWALWLTGTHFSVSAGVGFISIFGVAVMDGLLLVSYFNTLRLHGLPVTQAVMQGAALRIRPVTMTALTAIFGLLPAALSTRIGSQTQRPLAIVVVGAMFTTLFLTRYLMPVLYSFYGHREPPKSATSLVH